MIVVTKNKIASRDYDIVSSIEAGIALTGEEIKSIRAGRINLKGSYVKILNNTKGKPEAFVVGCHIHTREGDPYRTRKLLLHKSEIRTLIGKTTEKGLTLIPTSLYIRKGIVKVEVGLGAGLKKFDKREKIKKQEQERRIRRLVNKR
jgi:SsrA-binding protein